MLKFRLSSTRRLIACWNVSLFVLAMFVCRVGLGQKKEFNLEEIRPSFPLSTKYLREPLGLDKAFEKVYEKWLLQYDIEKIKIWEQEGLTREERNELLKINSQKHLKLLRQHLNAEQNLKLSQYLTFNHFYSDIAGWRESACWMLMILSKDFADVLGITPQQLEKIKSIHLELNDYYNEYSVGFAKKEYELIRKYNRRMESHLPMPKVARFHQLINQSLDFLSPGFRQALKDIKKLRPGPTAKNFSFTGVIEFEDRSPLIAILPSKKLDGRLHPLVVLALLTESSVADELDLSEEQRAKFKRMFEAMWKNGQVVQSWDRDIEKSVEPDLHLEYCQKIVDELLEWQVKKLVRIYRAFQIRAYGERLYLAHPALLDLLELDDPVREKLRKTNAEFIKERSKIAGVANAENDKEIFAAANRAFDVLTKEQQEKWYELTGEFGVFPGRSEKVKRN